MADIKDKKAMINNGDNIELDGATVINKVSLAEAKKEEPKQEDTPVVSEGVVIPLFAAATEVPVEQTIVPEVSSVDIPVAPVDLPVAPIITPEPLVGPIVKETQSDLGQSQVSSFKPDFAVGTNDFESTFNTVSYEKVASTIVTEEDAETARGAYLEKAAELYDKGPGNQIKILMRVASQMDELLEVIGNQGFVSGPNHEAIKKARLEYRGLVEKENTYLDNQDPNYGSYAA